MITEQQIEDVIVQNGLTAPRITPQDLNDAIDETVLPQFYVFPNTTTTVCLVTLKNGFTVTGESSAVSMENFDQYIGREVAYKNAREKLWTLLGFLLKDDQAEKTCLPERYRLTFSHRE